MSRRRSTATTRATALAAALLAAAVTVGGACADGGNQRVSTHEGLEYVSRLFRGRAEGAEYYGKPWYRSLAELVPTTTFQTPDGARRTAADVVGVGRIVDVERGKAFKADAASPDGRALSDYDDAGAMWWTAHVTVEFERAIASEAPGPIRMMLPAGRPADFGKLATGLRSLGRVLLFAKRHSPLTSYDDSLYAAVEERGIVLATVAPDGTLSLPYMPADRAADLLARTPTLQRLEDEARTPRVVLMVGPDPDHYARADGL